VSALLTETRKVTIGNQQHIKKDPKIHILVRFNLPRDGVISEGQHCSVIMLSMVCTLYVAMQLFITGYCDAVITG
jgi:hypothetical protein